MDITYLHIKRAIEKNSECFLCNIESEVEQNYLQNYLQELVMDAKAREVITENRGFCNDHTYKFLIEASKPTISDGHGVALVMQNIIEQLIEDLSKKLDQKEDILKSYGQKCPACLHIADSMKRYLREAGDLLISSDDFQELIKHSKGLCVQHFSLLASEIGSIDAKNQSRFRQMMDAVETSNLQRIKQELTEYIRRQSYEFLENDRIAISSVLLRSIEKIVGRRGMKTYADDENGMNIKSRKTLFIGGKQRGT